MSLSSRSRLLSSSPTRGKFSLTLDRDRITRNTDASVISRRRKNCGKSSDLGQSHPSSSFRLKGNRCCSACNSSAALGAIGTQLTRVANVQKYICDIYIIRYRFLKTRLSLFFSSLLLIHRQSRRRAACRQEALHSLVGIPSFSRETTFRASSFSIFRFFILPIVRHERDRRAEGKLFGKSGDTRYRGLGPELTKFFISRYNFALKTSRGIHVLEAS